ncbi:MAG TPA: HlyD family type I secretion periplasmic adaptor subunit [Acetobacteraceae bacterium]|nr:HlyD family type I secretion periplasmic adaptor subunit [Acetobacteraceae bacterium]
MNARRAIALLPAVPDRAFLPAALEIIETPPSPIRVALMLTICLFVAATLGWSWFGRIDIHAVARGKVEPVGHAKVIQPLEPGKVAEIHVTEGQFVKAGDVLLVLDRREAQAELAEATADWSAAKAEALRRQAEIDAVRDDTVSTPQVVAWPSDIPASTRTREQAVLSGDLDELSATLANLDDQLREKQAAVAQLDLTMDAEGALLRRLAERVALRDTLYREGNGSKLALLDALQSLLETKEQVATDTGRRAEAVAAITSLRSERRKTVDAFLADDMRRTGDAKRTADEKAQDRAKAMARLDHMVLTAPVDGAVQGLAVTNPGQVVTTSQEVMRLVPLGGALSIQAYIGNDDIGFVHPGQTAAVKLDAFPFTRYGVLEAEVTDVAYDAIPADAANASVADATSPSERTGEAPSAKPMTDLVFEARLQPKALAMNVNGRDVPLSPGMTVTVEIKTGSRRILEYLFSPLVEVAGTAGRER